LEEESQTYYAGIIYATKNERIYDEISKYIKNEEYYGRSCIQKGIRVEVAAIFK
jgi:hypothetical protein